MKMLIASFILILCSINAQATLLTGLLNGGSITAGDKLFDDWQVLFTENSEFRDINTDNIDVSALNDGGLEPGSGLQFNILNDEFKLDGDGFFAFIDFMFGFRVTVLDPGLRIKDNSLSLTGAALGDTSSITSVFIEERIYTNGTQADLLGVKDVEFSSVSDLQGNINQITKTFDSVSFAPRDSIYVTKNILIEADLVGEFAKLNSFEQRFSQTTIVPEPHAIMLWGTGLLLLLVRRRQRK